MVDRFGDVRMISLTDAKRGGRGNNGNPWDTLDRELAKLSRSMKQTRLDRSCLFAARHLAGFLHHASVRATEAPRVPFDFIRTSRVNNPVAPDLEVHLARFLRNFHSLDALKNFALPMMASSFILDHYLPGMHCMSVKTN